MGGGASANAKGKTPATGGASGKTPATGGASGKPSAAPSKAPSTAPAQPNKGASAKKEKGKEQPKKEEEPKLVVKDLETLVVEIGTDGEAIERGVDVMEAEQIFVVIDPRSANCIHNVKFLNDAAVLRQVMMGGGGRTSLRIFVLVPSTTSSKAHLTNAHVGAMFLGHWAMQNPYFIRADDYYHNGDAIMKAMVEEEKRVYPAEEGESMKAMLEAVATYLWPKRAYIHWPVGFGLEEGEVDACTILSELGPLLCDAEQSLPRIGDAPPADSVATLAIIATERRAAFLTFSEDSAGMFGEKCEGAEIITVTDDLFAQLESDELCGGELGGVMTDEANPVLLAGPADLVGAPDGPSLFVKFVSKLRELKPEMTLCVVLADESVDAFKENLWLIPALHTLLENADVVIFATNDEVKDAHDFFQKGRYERSDIGKIAMLQLIAFPRLHFFTLGTAIGGAELEDGEIMFPAVTVGPAGGNEALPATEKFRVDNNPFIFPGFTNNERVIPGEDDFAGVSLMVPAKLICSIITGVCENLAGKDEGATWAAYGEGFERDDMELVEASGNLTDLCAEFTQYLECTAVEEEEATSCVAEEE
jgi:hypothetical protein